MDDRVLGDHMSKQILILIVAAAVVLGGMFLFGSRDAEPKEVKTERTNREIATTCDPQMSEDFHIHPLLEIIANGQKIEIPANIGVEPTCMTALHTHTPDGIIHVESPEKRDFTLGDFFAVWKQPFSKDEILTYKADATHRVRITVDGEEVDTYENTLLKDGEQIVITYETI